MRHISLLDCTLRDGGYVNNWHFGYSAICDIIEKLVISNIEYIECGYLTDLGSNDENYSQYRNFEQIKKILPDKYKDQQFAVMINYGDYPIENIPEAHKDSPILRVCFHKKDACDALFYCKQLIQKGYTIFVQPMASLNYTDVEFVTLIQKVNSIEASCFYIVDSFGVMQSYDFQRLISIADYNLDKNIRLGYHSHNNLQQAYGNAIAFVERNLQHDIILDASVYGMGRGAGNLNMELFASYLNKNYDKDYSIDAFLDIMDDYLKPIFSEHFWGYSLPFYLSAQFNCHPNYADYFAEKNTLTNKSMKQLLASLPESIKNNYSKDKAEEYYLAFQKRNIDDSMTIAILKEILENKDILIIAPGKSILINKDLIESYISANDPVIIAINVIPADYKCDFLFCSNEKRLKQLKLPQNCKLIISSNIENIPFEAMRINYSSYLSDESIIIDNPTLMMLHLLISIHIKHVAIAGFDGYSAIPTENYFDEHLSMGTSINIKLKKNMAIKHALKSLKKKINLTYITKSLYNEY